MPNGKLLEVISYLDKKQRRKLLHFVQSPYFNSRSNAEQLIELLKIILRQKADPDAAALQKEVLQAQFFPESEFSAKSKNEIDGLASTLNKLVERFIIYEELEEDIERLAQLEDTNGKIRLCLMDTQRSISFIQRYVRSDKVRRRTCAEIQHDLDTLLSHTTFLFDKINFLMDAAQGFINIQQNQIIKIFSIAAVVFLPPTMIASIYGMNFEIMPELDFRFGYPMAIGLMFLSGLTPYWFFKRKGWL
mgnify:CR=1 FL=1